MTLSSDNRQFYKTLVGIALPIALQSVVSSSLTLLDNLMVSKLGELSLTSVGLATQNFMIEWLLIFGFCSGCNTFFTQFWGVEDIKSIKKVIGIALSTCMVFASIFFIAAFFFPVSIMSLYTNSPEAAELGAVYLKIAAVNFLLIAVIQPFSEALRATRQTSIPMYISIASFFTDVVFNYLLIFGKFGFPRLGVAGAAIATVIARSLETLLTLYCVFVRNNVLKGKIREYFSFSRSFTIRVYKNAFVTTINETVWSMAVVAQNAAYGHIGVTEYAAVQASVTIMDLFQMACFCIGDAAMILIGASLGRNDIDEARKISKKLIKTGIALSVFMAILLILLNKPLISLFSLSEIGKGYAEKLMIVRAVYLPVNLINGLLISGFFRAGGDTKFPAICEGCLMWLYAVPAAFIFSILIPLPVHFVLTIVQTEGYIKLIIMGKRFISGKWLNNMIEDMQ